MEIILIDSKHSTEERQQSIQLISKMAFVTPFDFVFDYVNLRVALALNFEGHPELVTYLKTLPSKRELQAVGGRFGRNAVGQLATSEWSGHYGEAWNPLTRGYFIKFMEDYGIQIIHREWHPQQTADQVG